MNSRNDDTCTDLYLVRIWKRELGDSTLELQGKLQHVVSGTSCHFEGLSSLPRVMEKMMEQQTGSLGPDVRE